MLQFVNQISEIVINCSSIYTEQQYLLFEKEKKN